MTTPTPFGGLKDWWIQAIHVIATVTVITEEQLVIVLRGATKAAGFALNALPLIGFNSLSHVCGELQAGRVSRAPTV